MNLELSVTNILVLVTCLVSYSCFQNPELKSRLLHYPYQEKRSGEFYRWISSGFIHGDGMHLLFNMIVLYQFGNLAEKFYVLEYGEIIGRNLYLLVYLATILFADIPSYLKHKDNPRYSSLGASGGTSGIMIIYCMYAPWAMFAFPPIPAILFAILFIFYSSFASKRAASDGIDHQAHFWGAMFGIATTLVFLPRLGPIFIDQLFSILN